ncbi:hypothetical protein [Salinivibrio socompensis]|uniref:hypothetical protein n=1 Tax=Salinivibrio socompensis TaxID=1510206 RepID=UPI00046E71D6|nr:hypothetical protein [Salinivibrio socompensis]
MSKFDRFLSLVIYVVAITTVLKLFTVNDMLEFVNQVVLNGIIIAFVLAIKLPIRWRLKAKQAKTRTTN